MAGTVVAWALRAVWACLLMVTALVAAATREVANPLATEAAATMLVSTPFQACRLTVTPDVTAVASGCPADFVTAAPVDTAALRPSPLPRARAAVMATEALRSFARPRAPRTGAAVTDAVRPLPGWRPSAVAVVTPVLTGWLADFVTNGPAPTEAARDLLA